MKANIDIRNKAKECGVYLWEVAQELGIAEGDFFKKMRKELTNIEKKKIFKTIEEISERFKRVK